MNFNKAFILGNVVRDPETKTTANGKTVCRFSIATNRVWNDAAGQKQQKAEFHNIVAWGKLADICSQYLQKGRLVFIEGRIETRSYAGADGAKKYWTEIIADTMQMGPKGGVGDMPQSKPENDMEHVPMNTEAPGDEMEVKDLPF